jgi:hypothetical protein
MIPLNFEAIEKLRDIRERSASAELQGSNKARDLAEANAAHFEDNLQMQTATTRAEQLQLCEAMVGKQITASDLDEIRTRVESSNAELDHLSEQCDKAKDAAASAAATADQARIRHAKLFRDQQKWAAIVKRETEKSMRLEVHGEELVIEECLGSRAKLK